VEDAASDRRILYFTAFLRATATGLIAVLLGLYLPELRLNASRVGAVVTCGLLGGTLATLVATLLGDRLGRRRVLIALATMAIAGGVMLAFVRSPFAILVVAFFGMLNGLGRDRSASLVLEQAMLPATTGERERTQTFAWHALAQDAGHALGSLFAGLPSLLHRSAGVGTVDAYRVGIGVYVLALVAMVIGYSRLSRIVDDAPRDRPAKLSPETRSVLVRICSLFALDSLGGGFLATALLSAYFHVRFGATAGTIGLLFFGARVANAFSHLGAAWLARRIGLVRTMVFTHIPSSLLLFTVAWSPNFAIAAVFFLLREGLVEMDVPTRQSYVMSVVRPEERTVVSGATLLVRTGTAAIAPFIGGHLMQHGSLATPLIVGASLKIAYDLLLYAAFRNLRPPEEASVASQSGVGRPAPPDGAAAVSTTASVGAR